MPTQFPEPPYYAVIFTAKPNDFDKEYENTVQELHNLSKKEPGFLGLDSAYSDLEITVSYWKSLDAIKRWKAQEDHLLAQAKGRKQWYQAYSVKICLVERAYDFKL